MQISKKKTLPLAITGGQPVRTAPLAPWPVFEESELEAVTSVLQSGKVNYWTGEQGRLFEQEFATLTDCQHAVALANGTVALELALYGLGVTEGDEVIVTSRSFVASASSIVVRGARPVFADVDENSQNITAATVKDLITARTRAIIAVHLAGWPCDMDPIMNLANKNGIKVIEDCAQAFGATYKGRPVGSLGHVAAFSFCQDKIITTGGEGGMLTTNDEHLWQRAWSYKDHGKSVAASGSGEPGPDFRWLHDSFGTNWRLTEMQSALGRAQLPKLGAWLEKRRNNAKRLTAGLSGIPGLRLTIPGEEVSHAYYKYYAFIEPERLRSGWDRDR
ncbi:MAG: aminotransferase, partial [Burkholderiales bacterium]|nr:aminotransferase [Burkholderiales bacterium]